MMIHVALIACGLASTTGRVRVSGGCGSDRALTTLRFEMMSLVFIFGFFSVFFP